MSAHYVKESGRFASISWVKTEILPFLLGYSATVLKGIRRKGVLVAYPYFNLVLTYGTVCWTW